MGTNKLDIIVLEEGKTVRRVFAEVDLLPDSHFIYPEVQYEVREHFNDLSYLAKKYLRGMRKASEVFYDILSPAKFNYEEVCDHMLRAPCTFVTPEAYQIIKPKIEKEKDNDHEVNPIAHFQPGDGIYLSLYDMFMETITGSIIHETGHDIHYSLYKEKYKNADPTLRELMAIFVQEQCGYKRDYNEKTPHHRAVRLLQELEQKKIYQHMTTAEKWDFLVDFRKHESLQEWIDDILK